MKRILVLSISFLALAISQVSHATNLVDAFDAALKSDPTYKQAQAQYDANKTLIAQARAGILPNLSIQANLGRDKVNTSSTDSYPGGSASSNYFQTQGYTLTVTPTDF